MLEFLMGVKQKVIDEEIMPFDVGRYNHMPYNALTGRPYGGAFNLATLLVRGAIHEWSDPRFVTIGKAKELGADFRGQKGTKLLGWRPIIRKDEETGEEERVGGYFYNFVAFNVQQFANLDDLDIPPLKTGDWGDATTAERIEKVKSHILANFSKVPQFIEDALTVAPLYRIRTHSIVLPPQSQYKSLEQFMLSLIHELMHATGGESELKRFSRHEEDFHNPKREYAYEEMVAQFATSFLLTHYGFQYEVKRSASYIRGWYRTIEGKPDLLERALKDATDAVHYIFKDNPMPSASSINVVADRNNTEGEEYAELPTAA